MRVLIKSSETKSLQSRKTGRTFLVQQAALEGQGDFPKPFDIMHDDGGKVYPPGVYTFDESSIYVGRDGRLSVSPRLVPWKAGAKS